MRQKVNIRHWSSASKRSSRLDFQTLSTLAKHNSEVWITINSEYIYPQDKGHILSAFPNVKKRHCRPWIHSLFSTISSCVPLVVNRSDISIKFIFSTRWHTYSEYNLIIWKEVDPCWTLQMGHQTPLFMHFKLIHTGGNTVLQRGLCRRERKMEICSLRYAHIYCLMTQLSLLPPLIGASRANALCSKHGNVPTDKSFAPLRIKNISQL